MSMSIINRIRSELRSNTTRCTIITFALIVIALATSSQTVWTISALAGVVTIAVGAKEFIETPQFKEWREKQLKKMDEPLED